MNKMLSGALREFMTGPLNQLIVNLAGDKSKVWDEEFKKFLRQEPCWTNKSSLLEFISTVTIPATIEKFFAKKKFVVDISAEAPVKINYLGENFQNWFLVGKGKIEEPIAEQKIRYDRLRKRSVDIPIITELGGEQRVETTLTELYYAMSLQPNGEQGELLTSGSANIFYIRDLVGVLRTVRVRWSGSGWGLDAGPFGVPGGWGGGRQVVSRNS